MQNENMKSSFDNYWSNFKSRELQSKENLFFHDEKENKYSIVITFFLLMILAVFFIIK